MTDWNQRHLEHAEYIAQYSKDPSRQVGAVIFDRRNRITGVGFNGFPRGVEDKTEWLEDKAHKNSLMVHAEANAILNAQRTEGLGIAISFAPCLECAKLIIQAGLRTVVHPAIGESSWKARQGAAQWVLKEAGVKVFEV